MANFKRELNKRTLKISQLGELINGVNKFISEDKSTEFLEQKANQIKNLWSSILNNNESMMNYDEYDKTHAEQLNTIQEAYDNAIIGIEEKKAVKKGNRAIELPELNIPQFEGDSLAWKSFYEIFDHAIAKNSTISTVEKLQLLKTLVKGEAEQMIKHLQISEDNFETAWKLLKKRYDNERRLVETYVKCILNLPNADRGSASLKRIHDTTAECLKALENLKINTKKADYLLNVIVQQKLDPETIRSYEMSIQNPRDVQEFNNLLNFIEKRFQTLERIEQQ